MRPPVWHRRSTRPLYRLCQYLHRIVRQLCEARELAASEPARDNRQMPENGDNRWRHVGHRFAHTHWIVQQRHWSRSSFRMASMARSVIVTGWHANAINCPLQIDFTRVWICIKQTSCSRFMLRVIRWPMAVWPLLPHPARHELKGSSLSLF